jgi:hypothetical protein
MQKLEVLLTSEQEKYILHFFLANQGILHVEHFLHTHSPLDNLCHYMWEEIHEPNHATTSPVCSASTEQTCSLPRRYRAFLAQDHQLTNDQVTQWAQEEHHKFLFS